MNRVTEAPNVLQTRRGNAKRQIFTYLLLLCSVSSSSSSSSFVLLSWWWRVFSFVSVLGILTGSSPWTTIWAERAAKTANARNQNASNCECLLFFLRSRRCGMRELNYLSMFFCLPDTANALHLGCIVWVGVNAITASIGPNSRKLWSEPENKLNRGILRPLRPRSCEDWSLHPPLSGYLHSLFSFWMDPNTYVAVLFCNWKAHIPRGIWISIYWSRTICMHFLYCCFWCCMDLKDDRCLDTSPMPMRHKRGCNCKKSQCSKKYCECYQVFDSFLHHILCRVLCFYRALRMGGWDASFTWTAHALFGFCFGGWSLWLCRRESAAVKAADVKDAGTSSGEMKVCCVLSSLIPSMVFCFCKEGKDVQYVVIRTE